MTVEFRHAETAADIAACFPAMRQLRPHLTDAEAFSARVGRQAASGYRILAAWRDGEVVGLAGYRPQENLIRGPFCYVDDLVVLDTDLGNVLGQRFYFRFGMLPVALRFAMRPIPASVADV